jgi:hypothetical protein
MQLQALINGGGAHFIAPASVLGPITSAMKYAPPPSFGEGAIKCAPTFHIHQADGLVLAWEQGETVDLFLANPPYLATKNSDLSGYRSAQQRGQSDSYLLFLDLALHVVRPNGWIGLVLPDPFLARANATRERQRLLAETTIHHLWHLSGVFAAHVGAVVLIAQKCSSPKLHAVSWLREKWSSTLRAPTTRINHIPQLLLAKQPRAELRYLLGTVQNTLIERLHTAVAAQAQHIHLAPLSAFVSIRRGEELGKGSRLLTEQPTGEQGWYPALRGGVDVHPYAPPQAQWWMAREAIVKPIERYLAPKLLVVKSTERLQVTLDMQGHVVLQTLYLLSLQTEERGESRTPARDIPISQQEDQLYFLMALLNSRLLREYVYVLHTAYKWVQPQIEQHVLARVPIPTIETDQTYEIITCAKLLRETYSQGDVLVEEERQILDIYEKIEWAVCSLYEAALSMGSSLS